MTAEKKMKAVASGVLSLGGIEVDCYVLEDGRRVVSQRALVRLLTSDEEGRGGRDRGDLGAYFKGLVKQNKDFDPAKTMVRFEARGGTVIGRDAQFIVDLCKAYKAAARADALHPNQAHILAKADVIIDALAGVGIAALVDEATGYQQVRVSDGLRRMFDRLLLDEAADYARFIPESLTASLCRTFQIERDRSKGFPVALCGVTSAIYRLVLGNELVDEVKQRNGYGSERIAKHHQFFAEETRRMTSADFAAVELISNQASGREDFWARMKAHFRRDAYQLTFIKPEAR